MLGNTAMKRKNLTRHAVIVEATKSTGVVMALQMKDMLDTSLQVERTKMEMQFNLFEEQMAYQQERDFRLHESTRLSILKQHEMVMCIKQLIVILGTGLGAKQSVRVAYEGVPAHTQSMFTSSNTTSDVLDGGLHSIQGSSISLQAADTSYSASAVANSDNRPHYYDTMLVDL